MVAVYRVLAADCFVGIKLGGRRAFPQLRVAMLQVPSRIPNDGHHPANGFVGLRAPLMEIPPSHEQAGSGPINGVHRRADLVDTRRGVGNRVQGGVVTSLQLFAALFEFQQSNSMRGLLALDDFARRCGHFDQQSCLPIDHGNEIRQFWHADHRTYSAHNF